MANILGYAEPADSSNAGLVVVVIGAGIILAAAVLVFVPIAVAWTRRQRFADAVVASAVLWGVLSAATVLYAVHSQMKWSRERTLRIESGYYDPYDNTDAPPTPWGTWTVLASAYGALLLFAAAGPKLGRADTVDPKPEI